MFYWEVLSGASWDGDKHWIEVRLWWFNDSAGTCYEVPFWCVTQDMSQLEWSGRVDFVFTSDHKAPFILLGFCS